MSKKDVLFIIGFLVFLESFIYLWIQNSISNNHIYPFTDLDNLFFNLILIMPLVVVPLLFIFRVDVEDKKKEEDVDADSC